MIYSITKDLYFLAQKGYKIASILDTKLNKCNMR